MKYIIACSAFSIAAALLDYALVLTGTQGFALLAAVMFIVFAMEALKPNNQ